MPIPRHPMTRPSNATVLSLNSQAYSGMLPAPQLLGVNGEAFANWRAGQEAAILTSIDAETRTVIECLPTGAGKTLIYLAEAVLNGGKVVISTSTKAQQDQIANAIRAMIDSNEVVIVMGQMNYRCEAVMPGGEFEHLNPRNEWTPVAEGPCQEGAECKLKDGGCAYYDQIRKAQKAKINVVNYAFWMTNIRMEPRFQIAAGPVDLLICDEAHETVEEVCGFLTAEITKEHVGWAESILEMTVPVESDDLKTWTEWAGYAAMKIDEVLEGRPDARVRKKLRKLDSEVDKIVRARDASNWVLDRPFNPEGTRNPVLIKIEPIWPLKYAENLLFRGAKKVIMSSATVRMKTATLLGLTADEVLMFEAASNFPVERRPIYRIPCVQMNHKNEAKAGTEEAWIKMVGRIIGDGRMDRQGIIHTVSYKRRNLLMSGERSLKELRAYLVSHSTLDARTVVERFISSSTKSNSLYGGMHPRILVSPSVTTGYDFKYDAARFQILIKLPFADTRAKVMKARCNSDPEYGPYYTATTIQQMTGRVVRAEDDWGETFIIDDNIVWFLGKYKRLFAKWWLDAFVNWERTEAWRKGALPKPPEIG